MFWCDQDRQELTPVAVRAGRLLAHRLYAGSAAQMDYDMVKSTTASVLPGFIDLCRNLL